MDEHSYVVLLVSMYICPLCSISRDRDSMHIMNRQGDKGLPCRIPLEGWKKGIGVPLISIDMEEVVTQDIMRLIRARGNRKCCRDKRMKDHSKRSKASSRSIFIIMLSILPYCFLKE